MPYFLEESNELCLVHDLLADPDLSREAGFGFCSVKTCLVSLGRCEIGISLLEEIEAFVTNSCSLSTGEVPKILTNMPSRCPKKPR